MTDYTILDRSYKVLGMTRGESFDKVKAQFKKLIKEYNFNISKDKATEEKAKEIIEAYKYIQKNHDKVEAIDPLPESGKKTKRGLSTEVYTDMHYELAAILGTSLQVLKLKYNVIIKLRPEENISFLEWLNQEVKIKALCFKIGKPREILSKDYKHYKYIYKNSSPLSFIEWLETELKIENICRNIGRTKEDLITEYKSELMSLRIPNIAFEIWLLKYINTDKNKQYKK